MTSASDYLTQGYNQATGYLQPYYQHGLQDYQMYRGNTYNMGRNLAPYNQSADYMYGQINQSPQDFYNQTMAGYSMSPYATNQMNAMNNATNQGASASGMYGSSAYNNDLQQNANNIMQGDQQQYFGNMESSQDQQLKYLQNLQGQQARYSSQLGGLAQMGYGSAGTMGRYSMENAAEQAQLKAYQDAQKTGFWGGLAGAATNMIAASTPKHVSISAVGT